MKKEKYPVLIYRDENFENETRAGIEEVFNGLVSLLAIWDNLNVGACADLWQLITRTSQMYSDAFQANVEVPAEMGKYQIRKDVFLNLVSVPVPNNLYLAAKAITKMPCFGYQNIWCLKDGKVIQDEVEVEAVINSRNIIAQNEQQEELGKAVIEYIRLGVFIDKRFQEIPWQYFPAPPWSLYDKHFANLPLLTLEIEQLRVILAKV